MYLLMFTEAAKIDVSDAASYYNNKIPGLGQRFKQALKQQLKIIKINPFVKAVRYGDIRLAVLNKFPYSIHYSVSGNTVVVYAVLSDYRNPEQYWIKGG